jgi:putative ABC transport system substrate-binding protein
VPIVFANVPDPVGSGIVDSLARPGGNITGFMQFEYSLTAKWLELLKEVAPGLKRVAVLRDATITPGIGQFAVIQSVAPSLGVEVSPIGVRDVPEIERAVTAFARSGNGGLIVWEARWRWSTAIPSSRWPHGTSSPRSTTRASSSRPVV